MSSNLKNLGPLSGPRPPPDASVESNSAYEPSTPLDFTLEIEQLPSYEQVMAPTDNCVGNLLQYLSLWPTRHTQEDEEAAPEGADRRGELDGNDDFWCGLSGSRNRFSFHIAKWMIVFLMAILSYLAWAGFWAGLPGILDGASKIIESLADVITATHLPRSSISLAS